MPWFPDQIIKAQEQYSHHKRNERQVLKTINSEKRVCIKMEEFTDHPVTVCSDPHGNGKIVAKFTHVLPGTPGNNDRNDQGWKYHCNTKGSPDHTPTNIFE